MNTTVYVDVLLVINYIINLLLVLCTAKCVGVTPKRHKIVAASLFGSLCSLTIFLPFLGFFGEIASKALLSAAIVRIALPYYGWQTYLKHWFVFFAVNFFFAGLLLGVWMLFAPRWLTYYNGVVYFNVSTFSLVVGTAAAYLALSFANFLGKAGRMQEAFCRLQIYLGDNACMVNGLLDSGNSLVEPFSGDPVIVCQMEDLQILFPPEALRALKEKKIGFAGEGMETLFRLVPYSAIGGKGMLPAFKPDKVIVKTDQGAWQIDRCYIALSDSPIGDSRYSAILSPECIRIKISNGGAAV